MVTRFSNDLSDSESFLEKQGFWHTSTRGALFAIDAADNVYVVDQASLSVKVFDSEFVQLAEWSIEAPGLRAEVAAKEAAGKKLAAAESGVKRIFVSGVRAMSVDPAGEHLILTYEMSKTVEKAVTRLAMHTVGGDLEWIETRDRDVWRTTLLADGNWIESDPEMIRLWGPRTATSGSN